MTKRRVRDWLVRLAMTSLIGFGVFLIYFQTKEYRLARQSEAWPKTLGVLRIHSNPYGKSLFYRYEVNGESYASERVSFGELGNRKRSAQWTRFSEFPDGKEVEVYYRPGSPEESTLVPALLLGNGIHLLLGGAFVSMGALGLLMLGRMAKDPHEHGRR